MADNISMIRSGLIRHAIASTMNHGPYRDAVLDVYDVIRRCIADCLRRTDLPRLKEDMFRAVKKIQNIFPDKISTICTHLLIHLPESLVRFGPVCNTWTMWAERLNRQVQNSAHIIRRMYCKLKTLYYFVRIIYN